MEAWLLEDEEQEHRLYLPTTRSRVWNTIELRLGQPKIDVQRMTCGGWI